MQNTDARACGWRVMSKQTIRVMLVDDHAVVRMGFRLLLEGFDDIEVVGGLGACAAHG